MPCSARARAALLIEKANERARSLPSALYFSDSPTKLACVRARRAIEKGPLSAHDDLSVALISSSPDVKKTHCAPTRGHTHAHSRTFILIRTGSWGVLN